MTSRVTEKPTGDLLLGVGFSSAEKVVAVGARSRRRTSSAPATYLSAEVNTSSVNHGLLAVVHRPVLHRRRRRRGFDVYKRKTDAVEPAGRRRTRPIDAGRRRRASASRSPRSTRSTSASASSARSSSSSPTARCTYIDFVNDVRQRLPATPSLHRRLVARHARQPDLPRRAARYQRASKSSSPCGDLHVLPARATSTSGTTRSTRDFTLHAERRDRLRRRLRRQAAAVLQELLRRRPRLGARLSSRLARPAATSSATSLGGNRKIVGNAELLFPMPGAEQRPVAAPVGFVDAGQVYGETDRSTSASCAARPASACAGSRRSARCKLRYAHAAQRASRTIRIQRFQFQIGTVF